MPTPTSGGLCPHPLPVGCAHTRFRWAVPTPASELTFAIAVTFAYVAERLFPSGGGPSETRWAVPTPASELTFAIAVAFAYVAERLFPSCEWPSGTRWAGPSPASELTFAIAAAFTHVADGLFHPEFTYPRNAKMGFGDNVPEQVWAAAQRVSIAAKKAVFSAKQKTHPSDSHRKGERILGHFTSEGFHSQLSPKNYSAIFLYIARRRLASASLTWNASSAFAGNSLARDA